MASYACPRDHRVLLREYSDAYLAGRDVSASRRKHIGWAIGHFARFLGRTPELSDLADESLNRWIDAMLAAGLKRVTVHSLRADLITLWRAAHFDGLIGRGPVRVKRICRPTLLPRAEPPERVAALLLQARSLTGCLLSSGISRAAFWTAFILFLWESGLRLGDALRVERSDIVADVLMLNQNKTGWPIVCRLSAECLRAIAATRPENRQRVFGDALGKSCVVKGFRKLARAASFQGGTKTIRKSGATAVESLSPGAAMAYLGHKTPGLAHRHYIDPRLIQQTRPAPPPLKLPDELADGTPEDRQRLLFDPRGPVE